MADYAEVSRDTTNRTATIQVTGCAKQTKLDVPVEVVWDTQAYLDLLEAAAQAVLANMDPTSPTYDASLVGG
jgi:hypothetical protein